MHESEEKAGLFLDKESKKRIRDFHTLSCVNYYFLFHGISLCINRLISNLRKWLPLRVGVRILYEHVKIKIENILI